MNEMDLSSKLSDEIISLCGNSNDWSKILLSRNTSNTKKLSLSPFIFIKLIVAQVNQTSKHCWKATCSNCLSYLQGGNRINSTAIKELMEKEWPLLSTLNLNENKICDAGLQTLLNKIHQKISQLQLSSCMISASGVKQLLHFQFPNLKILVLRNNKIGSQGLKILTKCSLPALQSLDISFCCISNEGAKYLRKGRWENLLQLRTHLNKIQNQTETVKEGKWKNLKSIQLSEKHSMNYMALVLLQMENTDIVLRNYFNHQLEVALFKIMNNRFPPPPREPYPI